MEIVNRTIYDKVYIHYLSDVLYWKFLVEAGQLNRIILPLPQDGMEIVLDHM